MKMTLMLWIAALTMGTTTAATAQTSRFFLSVDSDAELALGRRVGSPDRVRWERVCTGCELEMDQALYELGVVDGDDTTSTGLLLDVRGEGPTTYLLEHEDRSVARLFGELLTGAASGALMSALIYGLFRAAIADVAGADAPISDGEAIFLASMGVTVAIGAGVGIPLTLTSGDQWRRAGTLAGPPSPR